MNKTRKILSAALAATMILSVAACAPGEGGGGGGSKGSIFSRPTVEKVAGQRKDWLDVDSFACYYGPLTGPAETEPVFGGETVTALEALKAFDVAIIHSSQLRSDPEAKAHVEELKAAGTYVISYISIGEDDSLTTADGLGENGYASYYLYDDYGMPRRNNSWGSYFIDAGNPVWQSMILSEAKSVMEFGVDGLFLDTLDTVDVAYDTIGGMVDLVKKLDAALPDAKIVANRGFTIFPYISENIDGVMFESFSMSYDETTGMFVDRTPSDLEYNQTVACNIINRARRYDYMPVFCLDYINKVEYSYMPQNIYDVAWQYDFIPYTTYSRGLDVCPNPNIRPKSKRGELALSKLSDVAVENPLNADTTENNLAYAGNERCKVTVDSTFPGYSGVKPLNDGFYATTENHNQNIWATESWASENNNDRDHWIQFTFTDVVDISKVVVYWAPDGVGTPTIYSPREAYIEAMIEGEWKRVASYNWKLENGEFLLQQNSTVFEFEKVTTDRIRVFQPKGMGDATSSRNEGAQTTFSGIMWVSEVEIF